MFVAATSACFSNLPLDAALSRLVDLEYTAVEIMVHESEGHLKPSQVHADLDRCVQICRETQRLTPIGYSVEIEAPEPEYYEQFASCCKLAKATKVVLITVRAAELGTPFNAEVERLRRLVSIGAVDGVLVALQTETGRMTEDPTTAVVLCDNVKGLGLTLDPSHYVFERDSPPSYEQVMKHTCHVRLRDTSKERLQVRIGQGSVEYGKLVSQLGKYHYNRALCVDVHPMPEVDHFAEMRKIRLLLESLL